MKTLFLAPVLACLTGLGAELKSSALDVTMELQQLLNSEREVVVPAREEPYLVGKPLAMSSNQTLLLKPGTVLLAAPDAFHDKNDEFLTLENLENVHIVGYGAEIRMRKKDYQDEQRYVRSEWRHGIAVRDCRNVSIEGLTVRASGGDGLYIGTRKPDGFCSKMLVKNCVFDDNHRQGISVISAEELLIDHCILSNTNGTDPESGIDFEPNKPEQRLVNCIVRDTLACNNRQLGFHGWLKNIQEQTTPVSIRFERCTAIGGEASAHFGCIVAGGRGKVEFSDCTFTAPAVNGLRIRDKDANGVELFFRNCFISQVGVKKYTSRKGRGYDLNAPIAMFTIYQRTATPGGVRFENCVVVDGEKRPAIVLADPIDFAPDGFSNVTGTLNVSTPNSEVMKLYGTTLTDAENMKIK